MKSGRYSVRELLADGDIGVPEPLLAGAKAVDHIGDDVVKYRIAGVESRTP